MQTIRNITKKYDGKGEVIMDSILPKELMNPKCRVYAKVTLKPGTSFGWHVHNGESESYYVLSGEGIYDDNGEKRTVKAGDVTLTVSGQGHSMENAGSEDLVYMALVLLD
ncbi:MAG: cupin domain-containing protein [Lachnospiraceae bacterium]|nr:cupin domain-containing protein [Lachnospiraceae bacterium]MCI1727241.1 cupin domain-containing protein [Lachnospiraceae bacterium]